jgi:hypothetical protein
VPDEFTILINIDAIAHALETGEDDMLSHDLASALSTMAHEAMHFADWIDASGGKTPLEVFDQGQRELSIKETQLRVAARYAERGLDEEEEVERRGLEAFDMMVKTGRIPFASWIAELESVMGVRRPSP